jgi:hypothetical protein
MFSLGKVYPVDARDRLAGNLGIDRAISTGSTRARRTTLSSAHAAGRYRSMAARGPGHQRPESAR